MLLERHGIEARLLSYHEHNEAARVAELVPRLDAGERIALVCDAGLPRRLRSGCAARACGARRGRARDGGAGAVGGRDGARRQRPRRRALRVRRLSAARGGAARRAVGATRRRGGPVVAFESPPRLPATLRSLAAVSPERRSAVCRELTKAFEEVVARNGSRARRAFHGGAQGRDHARRRSVRARSPTSAAARAAVAELVAAGTPRRSPPRWSPASPGCPETSSTDRLCDNFVILFDNRDGRSYGEEVGPNARSNVRFGFAHNRSLSLARR